jgi:hypothetical protein
VKILTSFSSIFAFVDRERRVARDAAELVVHIEQGGPSDDSASSAGIRQRALSEARERRQPNQFEKLDRHFPACAGFVL